MQEEIINARQTCGRHLSKCYRHKPTDKSDSWAEHVKTATKTEGYVGIKCFEVPLRMSGKEKGTNYHYLYLVSLYILSKTYFSTFLL